MAVDWKYVALGAGIAGGIILLARKAMTTSAESQAPRFGVDTIADPTPIAARIAGSTVEYVPHDSTDPDDGLSGPITFFGGYLGRNLTSEAIAACFAVGLDVFSIYERPYPSPTKPSFFTRTQGEDDGADAVAKARAVHQPQDAPIYFAIDTDPAAIGQAAIVDYFQGVASAVQGEYPIGCYGSAGALDWLGGLIQYRWQCSMAWAWLDNAQSAPANIRQYRGNKTLWDGSVLFDYNFAPTGHFGGWNMRYRA